jgi:hypothetical protein
VAQYDSFLLQIWRSNRREGRQFSARLEHLQDGRSVRCIGIDALLAHLREVLEAEPGVGTRPDEGISLEHR